MQPGAALSLLQEEHSSASARHVSYLPVPSGPDGDEKTEEDEEKTAEGSVKKGKWSYLFIIYHLPLLKVRHESEVLNNASFQFHYL